MDHKAQEGEAEVHDLQNEASHDSCESDNTKGKRIMVAKQADGHAEVVLRSTPGSWRGTQWPFPIGYHTKGQIAAKVPNGQVLHVIAKHGDSVRVQAAECTLEGYVKVTNVVDCEGEGSARTRDCGLIEENVVAKQADGHPEVVLRAKPKGEILGKVPNGQVLQVLGKDGNSIRVRAPRCTIEGYVKAQNVIDGGFGCQPNSSKVFKSCADEHMVDVFQNYENKSAAGPIRMSRSCPDLDKHADQTAHVGVQLRNSRFDLVHRLLSPHSPSQQDAHAQASPRRSRSQRPAFVKLRPESPRIEFGLDSWKFLRVLGKGSFGEVFHVEHKQTGKEFAMKLLQKRKAGSAKLLRYTLSERNIMSYINHPYITSLQYAFQTPTVLVMVTDYCAGGSLQSLIEKERRLKEPMAQLYTAEILLALVYLHERHIVFRDLKPDNTCLDADGHCKLIDFGLAKEGVSPLHGTESFCGAMAFMAPEILKRHGYNQSVDVFGLGVLLFNMLTGLPPFYHPKWNKKQLIHNIKHAPLKVPPYVSTGASSLLSDLLCREPEERLGANDTKAIMRHPYFVGEPGRVVRADICVVPEDSLLVSCTSTDGLEVGGVIFALEDNVAALSSTVRRKVLGAQEHCRLTCFCGEDEVHPEGQLKVYSQLVVKCDNSIDFDALMRREVTVPISLLSDPSFFCGRKRHTHPANPFERRQTHHSDLQAHVPDWEYESIAAAPMEEEWGLSSL